MEKIVLPSDAEAATLETNIQGWISRSGKFFGTVSRAEELARWDGATHIPCPGCGVAVEKHRLYCIDCVMEIKKEKYLAREVIKWNGVTPLYSQGCDEFILHRDDLDEFISQLSNADRDNAVVQLIPCDPVRLRPIELDYWDDNLPDDSDGDDLPDDFLEALDRLNEIAQDTVASWEPGKYRVILTGLR